MPSLGGGESKDTEHVVVDMPRQSQGPGGLPREGSKSVRNLIPGELINQRRRDQPGYIIRRRTARKSEFSVGSPSFWTEIKDDPFHLLCEQPVWLILYLYLIGYFALIVVLAFFLWLIAQAEADSIAPTNSFSDCMMVSWQSITTVGYGAASTMGFWSNTVCCTVVALSVAYDAVVIGVFYTKLSHPNRRAADALISQRACVCYAQPGMPIRFECRVLNAFSRAFIDPSIKLHMIRWISGADEVSRVSFEFTELEVGNRGATSGIFLPPAFVQYPWSAVHYVDENSPLAPYVKAQADGKPSFTDAWMDDHVEILVTLTGTVNSTGNSAEARCRRLCHALATPARRDRQSARRPYLHTPSRAIALWLPHSRLPATVGPSISSTLFILY